MSAVKMTAVCLIVQIHPVGSSALLSKKKFRFTLRSSESYNSTYPFVLLKLPQTIIQVL